MAWKRWGPYLAERAWGTVREDYSPYGTAWEFFPHDHARSRTYRWNEDGLAGWCDDRQTLCLALAFWNGRDPILKERIFGLTGNEGNHSEDAKEYWWFLDSTPTHSYMRWRYHYPQREFPYGDLVAENEPPHEARPRVRAARHRHLRRRPLLADRSRVREGDPRRRVREGDRRATRAPSLRPSTCCPRCGSATRGRGGSIRASRRCAPRPAYVIAEHHELGSVRARARRRSRAPVLRQRDERARASSGSPSPPYPKDGINDHVVHGAATINPDRVGTKMAARYHLTVAPGETAEVRFELGPGASREESRVDEILDARRAEADAFYARLTPDGATEDEARVLRQAFAGMLWSKQFFHFDVDRWLVGDPSMPPPPPERLNGRNKDWRHLDSLDVLSMPDTWEYPWFASWDLAFHCVALAQVDGTSRSDSCLLLLREWYQHPNGQLPAYEWAFGDANPPVHAWAAFQVFRIDGQRDYEFLEARPPQAAHQLHVVGQPQGRGRQQRLRGWLPRARQHRPDRPRGADAARPVPRAERRHRVDGSLLPRPARDRSRRWRCTTAPTKTSPRSSSSTSATSRTAMNDQGLWDEHDGFYYDVLRDADGTSLPLKCRSMVGLIPITAAMVLEDEVRLRLPEFAFHMTWFERNKPEFAEVIAHTQVSGSASPAPDVDRRPGPPRAASCLRCSTKPSSCRPTASAASAAVTSSIRSRSRSAE